MRGDGAGLVGEEESLAITWRTVDAKKIRELAREIGVTPDYLIHYAVEEVLETAALNRANPRSSKIEEDKIASFIVIKNRCNLEDKG